MQNWSLRKILASVHNDVKRRLSDARKTLGHNTTKGDATEQIWLDLFKRYLPWRYQAERAHVVDSRGNFSDQIDIVILDRQYSPFIFDFEQQRIVAAESVYAVFEAKQTAVASHVQAAQKKVESVRKLHRTSLPIPDARGTAPPKPLTPVLGGLLTFDSDWNPRLGKHLIAALERGQGDRRLDLGCIAAHGVFSCDPDGAYRAETTSHAVALFLLELIAKLQERATVPMIDVRAYARRIRAGRSGSGLIKKSFQKQR